MLIAVLYRFWILSASEASSRDLFIRSLRFGAFRVLWLELAQGSSDYRGHRSPLVQLAIDGKRHITAHGTMPASVQLSPPLT